MKYFLDAQGTDGTDPAAVMRVYEDGTRIPLSEPELETPDMAAAREARIAAFRAKARTGQVPLADLVDVVLALVGD